MRVVFRSRGHSNAPLGHSTRIQHRLYNVVAVATRRRAFWLLGGAFLGMAMPENGDAAVSHTAGSEDRLCSFGPSYVAPRQCDRHASCGRTRR